MNRGFLKIAMVVSSLSLVQVYHNLFEEIREEQEVARQNTARQQLMQQKRETDQELYQHAYCDQPAVKDIVLDRVTAEVRKEVASKLGQHAGELSSRIDLALSAVEHKRGGRQLGIVTCSANLNMKIASGKEREKPIHYQYTHSKGHIFSVQLVAG